MYAGTSDVQVSARRDLVVGVVRDGRARVRPAAARRRQPHARAGQQRRLPRAAHHAPAERRDARWDCQTREATMTFQNRSASRPSHFRVVISASAEWQYMKFEFGTPERVQAGRYHTSLSFVSSSKVRVFNYGFFQVYMYFALFAAFRLPARER